METTKICTKCNKEKTILEFSIRTDTNKHRNICKECTKNQSALSYKKYYGKNKKDICERTNKYRAENKDKYKNYSKKFADENRDKVNKSSKQWRDLNSEYFIKYYQEHIDQYKVSTTKYYKTDKGKANAKNKNYKRRTITKQGDVTIQQLLDLTTNAKVCYWCNISLKGKKVHIDHYIPLSKGGEHTISNLVVSCAKCNLTKSAKDPIVFAHSIGKLL